jgi:hypothetical protein
MGEHLLDHQVLHSANTIDSNTEKTLHKQCFNYKSEISDNYSDPNKFDELTSKDLLKIQQTLHTQASEKNLISTND